MRGKLMAMMRKILGVIVGVFLGLAVVIVGDALSHALWPPPADPSQLHDFLMRLPAPLLALLPATWIVSAFIGAFTAAKIGGDAISGWIAGGILFAATLMNLILVRHPTWVFIAAVIGIALAVALAVRMGAHKRPDPVESAES